MDNPTSIPILQTCNMHNQPIVSFDFAKNEANCIICIQQKTGMVSAESYQQLLNEIINKQKENYINNNQLYQIMYNSILNYKNSLIQSLDLILQLIQDYMKILSQNYYKFQQSVEKNNSQQKIFEDLQKESYNQQDSYNQIINKVKPLLLDFQNKYLNSTEELIIKFEKKFKIFIREQNLDWNKVECEIIKEPRIKQIQECSAFAFNQESDILVVACRKEIVIYQFINGVISSEFQRLKVHTYNVSCLYFMKQSNNSFVSGGEDKKIIIWEFKINQHKWFAKQILKAHKSVSCVLMNTNEDLMISGSDEQAINFWSKVKNQWACQQTIETQSPIYAISLNDFENKLISCEFEFLIQVMQKESENKWAIVQSIKVNQWGFRLCFTIGDQFIFQPNKGNYLEIHDYDQNKKQFQILKQVKIMEQVDFSYYFPCQYLKQFKIILVKHGKYLNIFKINQAGDCQLIQSIEFNHQDLYGRLTDDGQHLITWDADSKEIQVRHLKLLK